MRPRQELGRHCHDGDSQRESFVTGVAAAEVDWIQKDIGESIEIHESSKRLLRHKHDPLDHIGHGAGETLAQQRLPIRRLPL